MCRVRIGHFLPILMRVGVPNIPFLWLLLGSFLNKSQKDSFLRYHGIPTKMTPRMPIYCWVRPRKLICFSPKSIQFHGLIRKKKNTVSFYLVSTTICSFGCDKLCFLFFLQTSFNCLQNKHFQSCVSYIIGMSKS